MRQGILAFGPRAVLPENPNVGAAIISGSIPQPSKGEELVEDVGPKGRRDLDNYKRAEILNYLNKHTMKETLAKYPEVSESTLKRMKRQEKSIRAMVHQGFGKMKRKKDFRKYAALGSAMYDFFIAIREANGAVGRSLLEEWVGSQPKEVQKDFLTVRPEQRNLFFKRWKRIYKVVYRRITGTKQYLPADYEARTNNFNSLLRSMHKAKKYKVFLVGDETGVRFEELPNTTLAHKGSKKVALRTTNMEKSMFTAWLSCAIIVDNDGTIVDIIKDPVVTMFAGVPGAKIAKEVATDGGIVTKNGWQTGDTFLAWVRKRLADVKDCILIVDLFSAHRDERVLSFLRAKGVDILFIPGGCTGILQIMDVVVNGPFKRFIRRCYMKWRAEQISNGQVWAKPTRKLLMKWVNEAWADFPIDSLRAAAQKLVLDAATKDSEAPLVVPQPGAAPDPMPPPVVPPAVEVVAAENAALQVLQNMNVREDDNEGDEGEEGDEEEGNAETPDEMEPDQEPEPEPEAEPRPLICLKCDRLLRRSAEQCSNCKVWLHPGCMSRTSTGKCPFC